MVTSDEQLQPRPVQVPSSLEDAWQVEYDGKSAWQMEVPATAVAANQRLILHFEAVATRATVWIDGQRIGEHLGGWTPFEFDITDFVSASANRKSWTLKVEVDELVGHNTQGFLPIITHHFGGIWQPVWLESVPRSRIDTSSMLVRGDAETKVLQLEAGISGRPIVTGQTLRVSVRPWNAANGQGGAAWKIIGILAAPESDNGDANAVFSGQFSMPDAISWGPANPQLYESRLELLEVQPGGRQEVLDTADVRFGFSSCTNDGRTLLWNGEPLIVRGVLNWGYAPPRIAPSLDEQWMRDEIRFAQERGFNLMKFCLWFPPKRYLELCDEMGMLAWIEYPTWHPRLDQKHREDLFEEYGEFFRADRNHVSIALRSLTCETGPSADIEVIRELYNLGKSMVPGAMIEDDSSWIQWNRIHDFYDDHPYGNNHTWVSTLNRLNEYVGQRRQLPLVLGEAIAADTWTPVNPFADAMAMQKSAHEPWSFAAARKWLAARQQQAARSGQAVSEEQLVRDSASYAMAMRKFQVETYRREVPQGGYVVSVIRDFPKAAMGMIDFSGTPKTSPDQWRFQNDLMVLLATPDDCRSFVAGREHDFRFLVAGLPGREIDPDWKLSWTLSDRNGTKLATETVGADGMTRVEESGYVQATARVSVPGTVQPLGVTLHCEFAHGDRIVSNQWPIWICPRPDVSNIDVAATSSFRDWFQGAEFQNIREFVTGAEIPDVLLTSSVDLQILDFLESGGSVLLLPGESGGNFKLEEHWFLRGAPALFRSQNADREDVKQNPVDEMLVELQHFDLAGPVIPRIDPWIERIHPKLLLWDNHDLREFRTHGLLFSMPVGESGVLMTSALNHEGESNAAGKWLLGHLIRSLATNSPPSLTESFPDGTNAELLRHNVLKKRLALTEVDWLFRPDRNDLGHQQNWQSERTDERDWSPIRIGEHWESQGYPDLNGWAWYRTSIPVPANWPDKNGWLVFTGADDYCEVFVNGKLAGSCGDLVGKETAFDLEKSIDIGAEIAPGQPLELVIAVNDWNGSGGLFRPIFIATEPGDERPEILTPLTTVSGK